MNSSTQRTRIIPNASRVFAALLAVGLAALLMAPSAALAETGEPSASDSPSITLNLQADDSEAVDGSGSEAGESEESPEPPEPQVINVTVVEPSGKQSVSFDILEGKGITFIDSGSSILSQQKAETATVTAPVAPVKEGVEFLGWTATVNAAGNAVVSPRYSEPAQGASGSAQPPEGVTAVRSNTGVLTTSAPRTGDFLPVFPLVGVAVVALAVVIVLLVRLFRKPNARL